jgi:BioD-like phosphotransacetylase family protein
MKRILMASTSEGAGKTSIIAGIIVSANKRFGYIKPLGDRLVYKRKKNVDHDALVMLGLLGLAEDPDSISLGFSHSKLSFKYDAQSVKKALTAMAESREQGCDALFIEGGRDLAFGASVNLDSLSLGRNLDARLVLVVGGDADRVMDDIRFVKTYVNFSGIDFAGVIINKIHDVDDFKNAFLKTITDMGIRVLGIVPFKAQLTHFSMSFLADRFVAKVIAGEDGLNNIVKNIFVGAMSTEESFRNPMFNKDNKLLITSGDRSDMIVAALEGDTTGVILTNNILPPQNILSKATEKRVPVLLVPHDTYDVARQLDNIDALLMPGGEDRVKFLAQIVSEYVQVASIIGGPV